MADNKFVVGIDAGHSLVTPGKMTPKLTQDLIINNVLVRKKGEYIKEFEFNKGVSEYLAKALERNNIKYIYLNNMSGKTDTHLSARSSKANSNKCNIVVSNHYNAYGSNASFVNKKGGLLVLRTANCSANSIKLATLIAKYLEEDIHYAYSYGVRKDVDISGFTLAILRQTNMPAVLIEYGFMDVWNEAKLMLDTTHQKKCAESTCKAICKYFGIHYRAESTDIPNITIPKMIKIIEDVNFRWKADFSKDEYIKGIAKKGEVYTVVEKVKSNTNTDMYRLKSGYYITTSTKYVQEYKK